MHAYTLEVDTGNYKGPKALLSLYETMTSIRARRRCNDPNKLSSGSSLLPDLTPPKNNVEAESKKSPSR